MSKLKVMLENEEDKSMSKVKKILAMLVMTSMIIMNMVMVVQATSEVSLEMTSETAKDTPTKSDWIKVGDNWKYYVRNVGYVRNTWKNIGGEWYHFGEDEIMRTGWLQDGNAWYFMNGNGIMQTGWVQDGNVWYLMNDDGIMQTGWVKDGNVWYFMNNDGIMQRGWVQDGSDWYYFDRANGYMQSGWLQDGNTWYFLDVTNGRLQTGWVHDGTNWYFVNGSGIMQTSKWIGDYYLLENGVMATNQLIDGYYVGNDGKWIPNYKLSLAERVTSTKTAKKTDQIITVAAGKLTLWEKQGNTWQAILNSACRNGRNGISLDKKEGDGKTPEGAYSMSLSFGMGNNPGTILPYRKITKNSYWISNSADKDYNTWQERATSAAVDEHLINISAYKYAIVVDYNTERIPGKGSAIFIHCTSGRDTAGCISVPESTMLTLMKSVKPGAYIIMCSTEAGISNY